MTDTELLKKKIDESGYKISFIAQKCGLTYQGFLPKMNGMREFKQTEIIVLRELLKLTQEEADEIFFAA
ncbi:MAG: toxin-antitoxin system, antitoxin component, Xre family protein [Lachnospiraceae bacterium]|nr:toxin-antitoxin system, antitoxin component, Xre family protein [Lachnospiraceae bacterium]